MCFTLQGRGLFINCQQDVEHHVLLFVRLDFWDAASTYLYPLYPGESPIMQI